MVDSTFRTPALSVPPNPNMIIVFPLYGNNQSMKND
jgi:hypothetical protein